MNEYYEANMPSGTKPVATTDTSIVKTFIKNKYVRKLWVDEDEDDPVYLFQSGKLDKKEKKKEKKKQKKEEKAKRKEERRKRKLEKKQKKEENEPNLVDFEDSKAQEDFGDFQEGESAKDEVKNDNGLGDLIGGDDGFGDFVQPEHKEDDFGDFVSSGETTSNSTAFNPPSQNSGVINNLSDLYNQNPNPSESSDNKYAALENLGQGYGQPAGNMFQGMNFAGGNNYNGFNQPQNTGFPSSGFGAQQPQSWANPTPQVDPFSQNSFPSQPSFPQSTGFGQSSTSPPSFTSSAPTATSSHTPQAASTGFYSKPKKDDSNDLFGLKATLKENNKYHKYDKAPMGYASVTKPKPAGTNAFSGLVSSQWNS